MFPGIGSLTGGAGGISSSNTARSSLDASGGNIGNVAFGSMPGPMDVKTVALIGAAVLVTVLLIGKK